MPKFVYWKREKKNDSWKFIPIEEVENVKKDKGAMFTTWMSFEKEPLDNERDDIINLAVRRYGDLPIDFDSKDDMEIARKAAIMVVAKFTSMGVKENDIRIFVSGGKGYHVVLDQRVFSAQNGDPLLPLIYKNMVSCLFPSKGDSVFDCIDMSLYNMKKGKMFRLPDVQRQDTGRFKTLITFNELKNLSSDEHLKISSTVRLSPLSIIPKKATVNAELSVLYMQQMMQVHNELSKTKKAPESMPVLDTKTLLPCTKIILGLTDKANDEMSFNEMCFSAIVPSLRESGYQHDEMLYVPEVEAFISSFEGSENYTSETDKLQHLKGVIARDRNNPSGFSCGSMRKAMNWNCACCSDCPVLIKSYFFDSYEDSEDPSTQEKNLVKSSDGRMLEDLAPNPVLNELLNDYSLSHISGKEVIIYKEAGIKNSPVVFMNRMAFEGMARNLPKLPVVLPNGKIKQLKMSDAWLESPKRRYYKNGIIFDPSGKRGAKGGYYNTWRGFPMTPDITISPEEAAEKCKLYRRHVEHYLCADKPDVIRFVWAWLSDMVKNPGGKKPGSSIVIKGGKGVGKSTIARPFELIMGDYCMSIAGPNQLFSQFNSHLADKILLVLEEAVWGGDLKTESTLKSMITETSTAIERKGFPVYKSDTYMRLIMCSNADWVVPSSSDERRFLILDVGDVKPSRDYFNRLYYEIENGGAEGLYNWLLSLNYDDVCLFDPPVTDGLDSQKLMSLNSCQEWWFQYLQNGVRESGGDYHVMVPWDEVLTVKEAYDSYVSWCKKTNQRHVSKVRGLTSSIFGKSGLCPSVRTSKYIDGFTVNAWRIGSLENARKIFLTKMNINGGTEFSDVFSEVKYDI